MALGISWVQTENNGTTCLRGPFVRCANKTKNTRCFKDWRANKICHIFSRQSWIVAFVNGKTFSRLNKRTNSAGFVLLCAVGVSTTTIVRSGPTSCWYTGCETGKRACTSCGLWLCVSAGWLCGGKNTSRQTGHSFFCRNHCTIQFLQK